MMALTPIIIGVADVKNKTDELKEPATLMLEAISNALDDTGVSQGHLKPYIDSIDAVRTWTWPYADLPGLLSDRLGLTPRPQWTRYPASHGGNQPAKLVDEAAGRISRGETNLAVVTGGEALASLSASAQAGHPEPRGWAAPENPVQDVFSPSTADLEQDIGGMHSIGAPIQVYPLYENAFRAHRQQSLPENNDESAALYAGFARVAAQHPYSWNYGKLAASKEDIGTVSRKNRLICTPYPLLMNAFNTVNLAGAVVLTSTDLARKLGVPAEKWVYPLGGAGKKEKERFWERPNFYHSEAISAALGNCLKASGLTVDKIDHFDLYSCFPIVPKLACHSLGIPISHPAKLSVLGGLTSFGGAGNNYSTHAIIEMTRQIRSRKIQKNGLILANGGVLSYQHAICLSSNEREDGSAYPDSRVDSDGVVGGLAPADLATFAEGEATIETYTVEFSRGGEPETAFVVGRLTASGQRFVANHGDPHTLLELSSAFEEQIGKEGYVSVNRSSSDQPENNVFVLGRKSSL